MGYFFDEGWLNKEILMLSVDGWGREKFNSAFIIRGESVAVIEPGHRVSAEIILQGLKRFGVPFKSVKYILVTHRHLDHLAGGPLLLKNLPNSVLAAHKYSIETLKNPSKMNEAAKKIFGKYAGLIEEVNDENRLVALSEGDTVKFGGGLEIEALATPGHTSGHLSFYERKNRFVFTGDAAGILCSPNPVILPTAFHPSFKYLNYVSSIKKILKYKPEIVGFAHYGAVEGSDALKTLEVSLKTIEDWVKTAKKCLGGEIHKKLVEKIRKRYSFYLEGFPLPVKNFFYEMFAAGLEDAIKRY